MLDTKQTLNNEGLNMNLNFIQTAVAQASQVSCIEDEVQSLLTMARDQIGSFEAMDEWLANELVNLPEIVEGSVVIKFVDSRKYTQFLTKPLSDALWVSAMKQLQYHGAVNYALLQTAFANWINDYVYREVDDLGRKSYVSVTVTEADVEQLAKATLAMMQSVDVVEVNVSREVVRLQNGQQITARVCKMSTSLHDKLNELIKELRVNVSMKCQPLKFKPKDWTDARNGIAEGANIKLIKGSKMKSSRVHINVLNAVNKLQSVKFTASPVMLEAARDMNLHASVYKGATFASMFKAKELTKEAFTLYNELETLKGFDFFFPVTMDKRGRMYYRGGLLSPQGVDFCKAAFQFADAKPLGKHGVRALFLHTANTCGKGKLSLDGRVKWTHDNWNTIMNIKTHLDVRKEFKGADVFQALVACKELQRLAQLEGAWADKESNLVCHQDGTCNGLQHMAAITGDRPTAVAVNCTASTAADVPEDIYGLVASAAKKNADDPSVFAIISKYYRDLSKNPVMVTGYGASESTIVNNIASFLKEKKEDVTHAETIAQLFLDAINVKAGAVTQLTEAIVTRMNYAILEGLTTVYWKTADGFIANTRYELDEEFATRVGNFYIRKRGMGKPPVDMRKTAQAMSPNFIHSIDSTHLRMVITGCDHDLVSVHDSIGSRPCDYFTTARVIREKFALCHTQYDALADLCEAIKQPVPEFNEDNDYSALEALHSSYIFS